MHVGWPQGIFIGLWGITLLVNAAVDGQPRTGTHKFAVTLCTTAIEFGILYWGGFFG